MVGKLLLVVVKAVVVVSLVSWAKSDPDACRALAVGLGHLAVQVLAGAADLLQAMLDDAADG
jgi:hypothetical protein